MKLAPIALFVYRRPEHTRRTLEALVACPELADSPIYVFCDGPKDAAAASQVGEARAVARAIAPAHTVFVERDENRGLAASIMAGVDELCARHGRVIVVEDDLEVAPSFLRFMNAALDRYADDAAVMQVSAYQFPVEPPLRDLPFFMSFPTSWGWATWARAWRHFDRRASGFAALRADPERRRRFDLDDSYPYFSMLEQQLAGRVDSWAIRWHLSVFDRDGIVLYPGRSLVRNIGFDGSGTHGAAEVAEAALGRGDTSLLPPPSVDRDLERRIFEHLARQRQQRTPWSKYVNLVPPNLRAAVVASPLFQRTRALPASLLDLGRSLIARSPLGATPPDRQDLDVYWDPKMAAVLDTWGLGNAWNEIELLLANLQGPVVDIACGTGKVMSILAKYPALELHGFDISDFLLGKAKARGIPSDRLRVADATQTDYPDDRFDYGYSIGSLEHFTDEGIYKFAAEAHRITRVASFHMIPVARSGKNEGWMKTVQSFHNNSVDWWLERFNSAYPTVHVLDSAWNDRISVGKWFLCMKRER